MASYDGADRVSDLSTKVGVVRSDFGYQCDRLGQTTIAAEVLATTCTIAYGCDGLQRLTSTAGSMGASYDYSYDLAGNRTGGTLNGTPVTSYSFNAAIQVVGRSYGRGGEPDQHRRQHAQL